MNDKQDKQLKQAVKMIKEANSPQDKQAGQEQAIKIIADIFKPEAIAFMESIKGKTQTTQDNYGEYLKVLTGMTGMFRVGFAIALQRNGGNVAGITSAMKILG